MPFVKNLFDPYPFPAMKRIQDETWQNMSKLVKPKLYQARLKVKP